MTSLPPGEEIAKSEESTISDDITGTANPAKVRKVDDEGTLQFVDERGFLLGREADDVDESTGSGPSRWPWPIRRPSTNDGSVEEKDPLEPIWEEIIKVGLCASMDEAKAKYPQPVDVAKMMSVLRSDLREKYELLRRNADLNDTNKSLEKRVDELERDVADGQREGRELEKKWDKRQESRRKFRTQMRKLVMLGRARLRKMREDNEEALKCIEQEEDIEDREVGKASVQDGEEDMVSAHAGRKYEVDRILTHEYVGDGEDEEALGIRYKIRWVNFPSATDCFISADDIPARVIADYFQSLVCKNNGARI